MLVTLKLTGGGAPRTVQVELPTLPREGDQLYIPHEVGEKADLYTVREAAQWMLQRTPDGRAEFEQYVVTCVLKPRSWHTP
jgi:hypothetical protein